MSRFRARNQKLPSSNLASFAKYSGLNPLLETGGSSIKHSTPSRNAGRCPQRGQSHVSLSKQPLQAKQRFIARSWTKPFVKRMSGAGNSPTEFLQSVLDWIIADVHRPSEILREITRYAHAIESESCV